MRQLDMTDKVLVLASARALIATGKGSVVLRQVDPQLRTSGAVARETVLTACHSFLGDPMLAHVWGSRLRRFAFLGAPEDPVAYWEAWINLEAWIS